MTDAALARFCWREARARAPGELARDLEAALGLVIDGVLAAADCERLAAGVRAARPFWTSDFGGEQYSLGRAFYTHLEQDKTRAYFRDAPSSDALVERHLPGMQAKMLELVAHVSGGAAERRRGWCGPGVHVFPAGEHVARHGGVIHFDLEGLTESQLARRAPALSLVLMLQPPVSGGGLRLWDLTWQGEPEPDEDEIDARAETATYEPGTLVVIDSYRLHQIQPFAGDRDRISVTAHAVEVDDGRWEVWF